MPQTNFSASTLLQEALKQESPQQPRSMTPPVQLPLTPQTPRSSRAVQPQPKPQQMRPISPGPVKMVIKNGVLMPKQKQRRYRTERPFACDHCSARFTLRSNMERHIKQQHPQYWAQRQRSGHNNFIRRSSSASLTPSSSTIQNSSDLANLQSNNIENKNSFNAISDQVKFAILAQQLKSRGNKTNSLYESDQPSNDDTDQYKDDLDEPKLFIDEDEDIEDDEEDDLEPKDLSQKPSEQMTTISRDNAIAKKIAKNILIQAMCTESANNESALSKHVITTRSKHTIAEREKHAKDSGDSSKARTLTANKDETDLASVSKLVDNATNAMTFGKFFNADSQSNEHSDEEGLVASGSASESNNSGTEDLNPIEGKKKSAYSLAPNRVSCPYCQRMVISLYN